MNTLQKVRDKIDDQTMVWWGYIKLSKTYADKTKREEAKVKAQRAHEHLRTLKLIEKHYLDGADQPEPR